MYQLRLQQLNEGLQKLGVSYLGLMRSFLDTNIDIIQVSSNLIQMSTLEDEIIVLSIIGSVAIPHFLKAKY